jgi:phage gp46-like protein
MDIKLRVSAANGLFPLIDLSVENGDLSPESGLETALILSLFLDRRALADDTLPDETGDRRGWSLDQYGDLEGDQYGSRQWLLARSRDLDNIAARAKIYSEEAVQWLVDDGVADRVEVAVERLQAGWLGYSVTVYHAAHPPRQYQFKQFWGEA